MKQLFSDVIGIQTKADALKIDYPISIGKASWQPRKIQKGLGGGDFWLWGHPFGDCGGGWHNSSAIVHLDPAVFTPC